MVGFLCDNDNNDVEPLLDLEVWWGVNPPLYFRGADEVGQSSPPSRGIGEIDPLGEFVMSVFTNVPARLTDTVLTSPVMSVEVNFNWVESLNHYEAEGTDLLDGEIFILTQSTSCPSLWHFDCIIIECDCEACHVYSDPMRLGTGNRGEIIEIALNELSARIAESVAVNEPTLQYEVRLTLNN